MDYEEEEYRVRIRRHPITKKRLLEVWQRVEDNKAHLIDAPARQTWHPETGNLATRAWYWEDFLHDIDGRAYTRFDKDGNIVEEKSFVFGELQELNK